MRQPDNWIKKLGIFDGLPWLFGDGVGSHRTSLIPRKSLEVFTKVYTFDPRFHNFMRHLVERLNYDLPAEVDDDLFAVNGIAQDFNKLLTVAGYGSSPASFVCNENADYAKSLGLPSDFRTPRHRAIFEKIWEVTFAEWSARPLKTPKHSTSGFPAFSYDPVWKREAGVAVLRDIEKIMTLVHAGELEDAARLHGIVFLYNLGIRAQVDNPDKVRTAFDLMYASSGGKKGQGDIKCDKRVTLSDGSTVDGFCASRIRIVQGAPFLTGLPLQAIATGHLYSLFKRYPKMFHTTDIKADAEAIPHGHDVLCTDISDYDRSMQAFMLDVMLEKARERWDERLITWCERLLYAPYYTRPLTPDGKRGVFVGASDLSRSEKEKIPYLARRQVYGGNRSGHPWTSLIAKVMKVADDLCIIDDLMGDVIERFDDYMSGRMAFVIKNNGDDVLLHAPRDLMARYKEYRFGGEQRGYFVASPELGQVYSGDMIMRAPSGGYTSCPRLHTMFEKMLVPERGINTVFRSRWTIGILARLMNETHPMHHVAIEAFASSWRDHMQRNFGDFHQMLTDAHALVDIDVNALTPIDKEVLDDPKKLYYKYVEEDVSPHVLEIVLGTNITYEEYKHIPERYYNGEVTHHIDLLV